MVMSSKEMVIRVRKVASMSNEERGQLKSELLLELLDYLRVTMETQATRNQCGELVEKATALGLWCSRGCCRAILLRK